jgi:tRNA G18 (ribose-2'-O)-methylase SpoU
VGLSPRAERLWTDLPEVPALALVLGEERKGLSDQLRALCAATVRLPMTGHANSLNVGVAAGVMLFELVRRESLRLDSR